MKKTALTFVALAFGSCVAFAQTTPQTEDPAVNTEETVTNDKMSNTEAEAESGLRSLEVEALPAAVQESLQADEFKDLNVVAAAEVQGQGNSTTTYYQVALAGADATQPSLIVLFDEKGKAVARKEIAPEGQE